MEKTINIYELLRSQLKPVLGCTEPASVGLASSIARAAIDDELPAFVGTTVTDARDKSGQLVIDGVSIEVDRDVYKNSYSVGIPGTGGQSGIFIAAALGLFCNPDKKLVLFQDSDKEKISAANRLVKSGKINLAVVDDWASAADINIKVTVHAKKNGIAHEGVAVIKHSHTNVVFVSHNGKTLFKSASKKTSKQFDENMDILSKLSLGDILHLVENLTDEDKRYIYNGILMNQKAYRFGLEDESGLGIGAKWQRIMRNGKIKQDLINQAKSKTAAAEDARMSGQNVEVMGTAGSGSHGIAMSVPIIAVAEETGWDEDKLIKSIALSNFITLYICYYSGYLSALCGCVVKSGVGASAGVAYYLGGKEKEIGSAIKNMTGDVTGVVCDGAKIGCAVKLATSAGAAVQNALLALEGVEIPHDNGIVSESVEETMRNIGKISKSLIITDKTIVEIMDRKKSPNL